MQRIAHRGATWTFLQIKTNWSTPKTLGAHLFEIASLLCGSDSYLQKILVVTLLWKVLDFCLLFSVWISCSVQTVAWFFQQFSSIHQDFVQHVLHHVYPNIKISKRFIPHLAARFCRPFRFIRLNIYYSKVWRIWQECTKGCLENVNEIFVHNFFLTSKIKFTKPKFSR